MFILKDFLDENGLVNYERLRSDEDFKRQIEQIEKTDLTILSYQEEFAFWINAYNLLTLKGVFKELEKNSEWKGNLSWWSKVKFFYLRRYKVAGKKINLYNIENRILRKKFKDPRLHFAINCASKSCPFLPDKMFKAESLDTLLDQLTRNFVNDGQNVNFDSENGILWLNQIFNWYKKDFETVGGVKRFILTYLNNMVDESAFLNAKMNFLKYNWELNAQKQQENTLRLDF